MMVNLSKLQLLVGTFQLIVVAGSFHFSNSVKRLQTSRYAEPSDTRRRMLVEFGLLLPFTASEPTNAVAPITQYETETGLAKMSRLLRSDPPKILRQRISLDFAVLLMRSSYAVTDSLDVIPMNQFQRDFFLIRSAEYEPYVKSLGPGYVKQGDLSDPSYFDFISFAQYLTINRALSDPATIFEEMQQIKMSDVDDDSTPQKFETVMVRRTVPNEQLADEFEKRLGFMILKFIDDTYGNTASSINMTERRPNLDKVQGSLTQLVKLFLVNGFAWEGSVAVTSRKGSSDDASGATFCLTLISPASIWGHQSLQRQRSPLRNNYLLKTAKELVRRWGYDVVSSSVKIEGNKELNYLTIG